MTSTGNEKDNSIIYIFLSHKVGKDSETAKNLKDKLESIVANKIEVFISEEIPRGEQWRDRLCEELKKADVFIFLYTSPIENWDWCHFEAGAFIDLKGSKNKPTLCLHGSLLNKFPKPFQSFQNLCAKKDDIKYFLHELIAGKPEEPVRALWCKENTKKLEEIAKDIVVVVENAVVEDYDFEIPSLSIIYKKEEIENSTIKIKKKSFEKIFNTKPLKDDEISWNVLKEKVCSLNPENAKWVSKLKSCLGNDSFQDKIVDFHQISNTNDRFSIHCQSLQELGSGSKKLKLLFIEQSKDLTIPIDSFDTFIEQLIYLFDNSKNETIRFLAYTPSIGYIAKEDKVWNRLEQKIMEKSHQIEIICLTQEEGGNDKIVTLEDWHNAFIDRPTDRGIITQEIADEATSKAENIIAEIEKGHGMTFIKRLPFVKMPKYYLFSTSNFAISVIPFFVPPFEGDNDIKKSSPNVEMIGVATNNVDLINKVNYMIQDCTRL